MAPDLLSVHRLVSPCSTPRRPRVGKISLHDTSLSIWEEEVNECDLRRKTFVPLIAHLKHRGWTVSGDPDIVKNYPSLVPYRRLCRRGPLEATLELTGRVVRFEIHVADADRKHGGRHGFDKLLNMTSAQRMLTLGTLLSTARYLVKRHGYPVTPFKPAHNTLRRGWPTALDYVRHNNLNSGHYKEALGRADWHSDFNRTSGDGVLLEHGQTVYAIDHKGRIVRGRAFYQLGNRWWVVLSETRAIAMSANEILVSTPDNLRIRRNVEARRGRLESELHKAIRTMDFARATLIKSLLFSDAKIYRIWSEKRHAWYRTQAMGYTDDSTHAGLFREDEVRLHVGKIDYLKAVPVAA